MKKIVYIFILLFISINIFGQSNDEKAKAAYLKASDEFDNGSYQSCITTLEEAKSLLGNSNARIQYFLSKSYYQLENYKQTKTEIQKYFDCNPKVDDWYKEMTELTEKVDKKLAEGKENTKSEVNTNQRNGKYSGTSLGTESCKFGDDCTIKKEWTVILTIDLVNNKITFNFSYPSPTILSGSCNAGGSYNNYFTDNIKISGNNISNYHDLGGWSLSFTGEINSNNIVGFIKMTGSCGGFNSNITLNIQQ